jgi:hypothetical protein
MMVLPDATELSLITATLSSPLTFDAYHLFLAAGRHYREKFEHQPVSQRGNNYVRLQHAGNGNLTVSDRDK